MWNLDDKSLFRTGALSEMKRNKNIDAPEMFLDAAVAQFMPDEERAVVEEIARFMNWIKDIEYHVDRFDPHEISVGLQLPAGNGFITLALRASTLAYNEDGSIRETSQESVDVSAVMMLKKLISTYHAVADAVGNLQLSGATRPTDGSSTTRSDGVEIQEHDAESLEIGSFNGKKTFRIRGGWFTQYGAAVYPETLKACGYGAVVDLPVGAPQPFAHKISVEVKAGKPKVIRIYD